MSIRDKDEAMGKLSVYCLMSLAIGILMFTMAVLQTSFFAKVGAKMAKRLR